MNSQLIQSNSSLLVKNHSFASYMFPGNFDFLILGCTNVDATRNEGSHRELADQARRAAVRGGERCSFSGLRCSCLSRTSKMPTSSLHLQSSDYWKVIGATINATPRVASRSPTSLLECEAERKMTSPLLDYQPRRSQSAPASVWAVAASGTFGGGRTFRRPATFTKAFGFASPPFAGKDPALATCSAAAAVAIATSSSFA